MAVISSSSSDTSSESSTGSEGFRCIICFESFPTGQALGRHQNIHLIDRWPSQTDLNFPPPPELFDSDDSDSVSSSTDLNLPPPLEFDFPTEAEEESLRSLLTPNLFGEWETPAQQEAREAAELLARVELSEEEEEEAPGVDLELRLRISPGEVDLELKLGH